MRRTPSGESEGLITLVEILNLQEIGQLSYKPELKEQVKWVFLLHQNKNKTKSRGNMSHFQL